MVELRNDQLAAEDSQGTHFFHNITAMGIKYMTVTENDASLQDFINWQWLASLPAHSETEHIRHVRLPEAFIIKVDSTTSRSVIFENKQ